LNDLICKPYKPARPVPQMSLYTELVAAGCEIDHHESDLYVKITPDSRPIIERHCWAAFPCEFTSNGAQWWDVAFAYDPFWQKPA
jgi:hypothetical protein